MIEVTLDEADRLDWALKQFKRKVQKAGVLKDLRKKRHYEKPSVVRQRKAAAARRRVTSDGRPKSTKSTKSKSPKAR
jgi:small subunit ribosomal protein S21